MTNYNQTVVEGLRVFGGAPTNKWNAYTWNSFKWGEGTNPSIVSTIVLMSEVATPSQTDTPSAYFYTEVAEAAAPEQTDTISAYRYTEVAEDVSPAMAPTLEVIGDGSGYSYVFPNNTTNLVESDTTPWSSGTVGAVTWSSGTVSTTTWS